MRVNTHYQMLKISYVAQFFIVAFSVGLFRSKFASKIKLMLWVCRVKLKFPVPKLLQLLKLQLNLF